MGFNTKIFFALSIMSIIFIAIISFVLNLSTVENFTVDDEYNETFNTYQETVALYRQQQEVIEGGEFDSDAAADTAVYLNPLTAAKQTQSSLEIFINFIRQIPEFLGIPAVVLGPIIAVLGFAMLMGLVYLFVGRKP